MRTISRRTTGWRRLPSEIRATGASRGTSTPLARRQPPRRRDRDRRHGHRGGDPPQGEVVRSKNAIIERFIADQARQEGGPGTRVRLPAGPLAEVFASGALFDLAWLAVSTSSSSPWPTGFIRYDVR